MSRIIFYSVLNRVAIYAFFEASHTRTNCLFPILELSIDIVIGRRKDVISVFIVHQFLRATAAAANNTRVRFTSLTWRSESIDSKTPVRECAAAMPQTWIHGLAFINPASSKNWDSFDFKTLSKKKKRWNPGVSGVKIAEPANQNQNCWHK